MLDIINHAGAEAFKLAVGALPMLILALVFVMALRQTGTIQALTQGLAPLFATLGLEPDYLLPTFTKYVAGGTAMMGVMDEMFRQGQASIASVKRLISISVQPPR